MHFLIYKRYIIKNLLNLFVTTAFVITGIIWITQILRFLYLIDLGIEIINFLKIIFYIIPSLLFIILPFITFFAIIYSYHNLFIERQLIILRSSGLNNRNLASPAIIFCILTLIFAYSISFYLMPKSYSQAQTNIDMAKNSFNANIINEGEFTKISKNIVLYSLKKTKDNLLEGLILFDEHEDKREVIIFAQQGKFKFDNNNLILELKDGLRQAYDNNDNLTKLYFKYLNIILQKRSDARFESFAKRSLKEYFIHELIFPLESEINKKYKILIAEGHQRIIWPLYVVILPTLALSILLNMKYSKSINLLPIFYIVCIATIITYLHFLFHNMSVNNLNFIYCSYFLAFLTLFLSFSIISRA